MPSCATVKPCIAKQGQMKSKAKVDKAKEPFLLGTFTFFMWLLFFNTHCLTLPPVGGWVNQPVHLARTLPLTEKVVALKDQDY